MINRYKLKFGRVSRTYLKSKMSPKPFKVSIEGNIGSGKSTCLNFFNKFENVQIHPEPIDKWRNVGGHNLFGLLYANLNQYNFSFQHYVQLTRLEIQTSPPMSNQIDVKMFERSVQNNRYCFIENARKKNLLAECEFEILKSWYNWIENNVDISLDLIVYLKSTPDVVWHRMVKRNRLEESKVQLSYLKDIHASYEDWLNTPEKVKCEVLTIDADKDLEDVIQQLTLHTDKILGKNRSNGES